MVTRIIQGIQDNPGGLNNYFKLGGTINPLGNCDFKSPSGENSTLMAFDKGYEDSEYDIYNFTFPGNSGRYFYPGTTKPVISPSKNILIDNSQGTLKIVDESGVTYNFGQSEFSFTDPRTNNSILTEIISADKADTVRYTYNIIQGTTGTSGPQSKLVINDQVEVRDQFQWIDDNHGPLAAQQIDPTHETITNNYIQNYTFAQLLTITFRTGHIAFNYNGQTLTRIDIYNNTQTTPIKSITLQQSKFGNDFYKLDQVNFFDSALQQNYSYKLNYTGTPFDRMNTGIDYWGFRNGAAYITDYVPNFQVATTNSQLGAVTQENITVGGMDRTANEQAMHQGMLNKITYPTGGSSVFTFEAHRYNGGKIAGGLRIKKIDNYDLNGSYLNSKWYTYGQNENGDGTIYKEIDPADYCYDITDIYDQYEWHASGGGLEEPNPTYTFHERSYSAFPKFANTWNGSSVVYDYVTEYAGDGVNANGKTVYNYENISDQFIGYHWYSNMPQVVYSNSWKTGQLLSKQIYSKVGSGYNLVYSTTNQYQDFNRQDYHCLKIFSNIHWHFTNFNINDMYAGLECFNYHAVPLHFLNLPSVHAYGDYYLTTGLRLPVSTTEIKDGVSTTTQYTYDSTYLKPKQTIVAKSNADNLLTTYTYPYNLTAAPYPAMVTNNIIDPVITQSIYKNSLSQFLESNTTNYSQWGNSLYAPQSVTTQKGTNPADTRLSYDAYDNWGNVTQRHKSGGAFESYIWDYNNAYPIASVSNAAVSDIAYTSFEADGSGNWKINSASRVAGGITGRQAYQLTNGSVSKSGLSAATTYIVSYWSTSANSLSITGTLGGYQGQGPTINGWTYFEHHIKGQTTISLIGSGVIDELRLYPETAQMTSYTFNPLIGMASLADAMSKLSYYEYDSFGRLMNIKDQYGNIIKSICYNYAGQPSGCNVVPYIPPPPPPVTTYSFYLTNKTSVSNFAAVFNSPTTGATYTFNFPLQGVTSTIQLPADSYNLSVRPVNANNYTFTLGSRTPIVGIGASFGNVNIGPSSSDQVLTIQ